MSYAQTALDREAADTPISNATIEDLSMPRVLFFAGDAIPPHEKYEMPSIKGPGGIHLPHIRTMPQGDSQASRGMLYQCKLSRLTTKMKPEYYMMLSPEARKTWEKGFQQTVTDANGQTFVKTVNGFTGSDFQAAKEGRFETKNSNHLVFSKRYPGQDVRQATKRSLPQGIGGVVEITALKGATNAEVEEAQYFFFPNWDRIAAGVDLLPESIDGVEKHIKLRTLEIKDQGWDADKVKKYRSISMDMIKSCSEFKRTGKQIIEKDESAFKTASEKDPSQTHSPISDHLLGSLGIQRKGDLLAGDHQALTRVANAMEANLEKDGPVTGRMSPEEIALEQRKLDIEERKLRLEEAKAGITPISTTVDKPVEISSKAYVLGEPDEHGMFKIPVPAVTDPKEGETITEAFERATDEVMTEAGHLEFIAVHDTIRVAETDALGTVTSKAFGRYKVQMEGGDELTFQRNEIEKSE